MRYNLPWWCVSCGAPSADPRDKKKRTRYPTSHKLMLRLRKKKKAEDKRQAAWDQMRIDTKREEQV